MIFDVELRALRGDGDGADADVKLRRVTVPEQGVGLSVDALLERIFYYGQNDFQPQPGVRSVSVGDVVRVTGGLFGTLPAEIHRYIVMPAGFRELNPGQLGGSDMAYDLEVADWDRAHRERIGDRGGAT